VSAIQSAIRSQAASSRRSVNVELQERERARGAGLPKPLLLGDERHHVVVLARLARDAGSRSSRAATNVSGLRVHRTVWKPSGRRAVLEPAEVQVAAGETRRARRGWTRGSDRRSTSSAGAARTGAPTCERLHRAGLLVGREVDQPPAPGVRGEPAPLGGYEGRVGSGTSWGPRKRGCSLRANASSVLPREARPFEDDLGRELSRASNLCRMDGGRRPWYGAPPDHGPVARRTRRAHSAPRRAGAPSTRS